MITISVRALVYDVSNNGERVAAVGLNSARRKCQFSVIGRAKNDESRRDRRDRQRFIRLFQQNSHVQGVPETWGVDDDQTSNFCQTRVRK